MTAPLRTLLIGAGRIAHDYIGVLETTHGLALSCVVDPDLSARQAAAALAAVPTFASLDDALATETFDAALVLAPPATHALLAMTLLGRGMHVFCEKPLAISPVEAEAMLRAATEADRTLMMATKFRFVDDVAQARKLVAEGAIGRVAFYGNSFCSKVDMTTRWNSDRALSGGGVVIDNGTHSIDLARFLVGPIARVSATFGPREQNVAVEDSAVIMFEGTEHTIGRIELSWSVDKPTDHYVEMHGSRGTLQIGWKASRYRTDGDAEWTAFGSGYDKRRAFAAQLAHFAAVARGDAVPTITAQDALASVRVVEAAYRAAADGTWETIPPDADTESA